MEQKEFTIPVSWGHIAVKSWGNEDNTPVIVSHGLQDNAGIFDSFIPLLPTSFYYICIDLPGHGRSSHCSSITYINPYDTLVTFKLVVDHLKRDKYIFLCHSWSGKCAMLFSQLYPEHVIKLILIDAYYFFPTWIEHYKEQTNSIIDTLIRINEKFSKNKQPSYTYEEATDKLISKWKFGVLSRQTTENLLKRSLIKDVNGKYTFSTDPKMKGYLEIGFTTDFMIALVRQYPIQCPILYVMASETRYLHEKCLPIVEEIKKYSTICKVVELTGSHCEFSNRPEVGARIVADFLTHIDCKL